jgi:hypothetical protein
MFTSDVAAVILEKHKGEAALLKKEIPHLTEQQCVTHREDIGIDDAWKNVYLMKEVETLLLTVYAIFSGSSVNKSRFEEMVRIAKFDVVSCRTLSEIRWLSRIFAVKRLVINYEALVQHFWRFNMHTLKQTSYYVFPCSLCELNTKNT